MANPKWYSPQLSRDLVSQLYHRAKFERVPMTRLANRLLAEALSRRERETAGSRVAEEPHPSPG
jgi:hypothetical protein